MTYDEYCSLQEDILDAFRCRELNEYHVEREMEMLQEQWEEEGEE